MTPTELKAEWDCRYLERIAIMCGTDQPTPQQVDIAFGEANECIAKLRQKIDSKPAMR